MEPIADVSMDSVMLLNILFMPLSDIFITQQNNICKNN